MKKRRNNSRIVNNIDQSELCFLKFLAEIIVEIIIKQTSTPKKNPVINDYRI